MVPPAQVIELAPYRADAEVQAAETQVRTIVDAAHELEITDEATNAIGLDMLSQARKAHKRIEALKKRWLDPLNAQIKVIRDDFAALAAPAKEADQILSAKTSAYRVKVAEAARKEQERLRLLAEKRQAKAVERAEAKGVEAPPVIPIAPTVAPPAKSVTAEDGSRVTYVIEYHAEIIDAAAVPREWCCPDEKRLGAAARAKIITPDDCPAGVRVIAKEKPRFYKGR